jgi:hypothetical protein
VKLEEVDLKALHKDLQQLTDKPKHRGWLRRNWRWFVPFALLTTVVVGFGVGYWAFYLRVYNLDACQSAMDAIEVDSRLLQALGDPIQTVKWPSRAMAPSARVEDNEIDIIWHIEGPKGQAKVHLLSKNRSGHWDNVMLDVTLADGKKIAIRAANGGGNEAAAYVPGANSTPPKSATKEPETKKSDLDINLSPDDDAPGGK